MEPSNGLLDRFRTAFKELVTPAEDPTDISQRDGLPAVCNHDDTESPPIHKLEEGRTKHDGEEKEEVEQLETMEEMKDCSSDEEEESEFVIIEPHSPPPYIEQCIDVCPVEWMPLPEVVQSSEPVGFRPSLGHTPSSQPLSMSPSFFDRSLEFLRRELDTIKYTIGSRPNLTHAQWFDLFNSEGQMIEQDQFYQFLLNYEWPDELLQEGWKFLFGYYDLDSQHSERVVSERESGRHLHESLKLWQDLEGMEGSEGDRVRKLVYLINKDVHRTDREQPFYRDNEENSDILKDLLVTYSFLNPDVGYVQGMNELLSMFLITIDDNVAAYWSYNNYLTRNKIFYSSEGLMAKLNVTAELVATHDAELYERLVTLECGNMLFCQRWLLLGFKRESKNFPMAVKIFTMLNAVKPTHYLTLQGGAKCDILSLDMFLVVAVLTSFRKEILSFKDQTDVYQWTCKLKLADMAAMASAKQLYTRYARQEG